MQARQLEIHGAVEFTPKTFPDHRGLFAAPFQEEVFVEAVGHRLRLAQANHSVSSRGVLRGLHFADVPPGQAKYVYCPSGELLDVVVDLRVGSPTFGRWEAVRLDSDQYRALYIPEGLGHGFVALADDTVMSYFCSTPYNPPAEHAVDPFDPDLALPWSEHTDAPILSEKDQKAPSLRRAVDDGLLPHYQDCLDRYAELREQHRNCPQ